MLTCMVVIQLDKSSLRCARLVVKFHASPRSSVIFASALYAKLAKRIGLS